MLVSLPVASSGSSTQIQADTDSAHKSCHSTSREAQQLANSSRLPRYPSSEVRLVQACSAPNLFAKSFASSTDRPQRLPVLQRYLPGQQPSLHKLLLCRVARPSRRNSRKAAATFPDCSDLSPAAHSQFRAFSACSGLADKKSPQRPSLPQRTDNPRTRPQTAPVAPPASTDLLSVRSQTGPLAARNANCPRSHPAQISDRSPTDPRSFHSEQAKLCNV